MTRRELALDSFWTERPLVALFTATTGLSTFSLRQLIAFAETLPDATFRALTENNHAQENRLVRSRVARRLRSDLRAAAGDWALK